MTEQDMQAAPFLLNDVLGATITPTQIPVPPPPIGVPPTGPPGESTRFVGWGEPVQPTDDKTTPPSADHSDGSGPATRPVKGRSRRIEYVGFVITVASLLLVLFLLYLYVFSGLTGARNQNRLLHLLSSNPQAVFALVTGHQAHNGQPVAVLNIPSLELHQAVVEGTTAADLQLGPGLASGDGLPGTPGDAVIAGKRVSFGGPFAGIGGLKQGDQINVIDAAGNFTYSVTSVETVSDSQISAPQYGRSWLTLVTSNSSWLPSGKLIVIARVTKGTVASGSKSSSPRTLYTIPSFAGDPSAGFLAAIWAFAVIGVLGLMIFTIRRWRQTWVSWLLAAPLILACGLFACESLARCLPSTL
jgi:LPXTG-site transpeptidase (sortase) family protein